MESCDYREIVEVLKRIGDVQEGQDLSCTCTSCYWNMFRADSAHYNTENFKVCISESLGEFKMKPNTKNCPGYWER